MTLFFRRREYLSTNPMSHAITKHIEFDYHFLRDRVAQKLLHFIIMSSEMVLPKLS
jgi:hypothetical protein